MSINEVLKSWDEIGAAYYRLERENLRFSEAVVKCWDLRKAFEFIVEHGNPEDKILDAGTCKCRVLEMLDRKGYHNLYGCDLSPIEWRRIIYPYLRHGKVISAFKSLIGKGPIKLSRQDLQYTTYPSNFFHFITCLSVIEHGVDIKRYFKEMSRLLCVRGYLIISTDYWHVKINTQGLREYGLEWWIFDRRDIESAILLAKDFGLELIEPINFSYKVPIIEWKEKKFTFIFFILKKINKVAK